MVSMIMNVIDVLFGNELTADVSGWMMDLLEAIVNVLKTGGAIDNAFTLFSGIAISLLTLYFFMELYNNVSREMFTVDKLVVSLIKFFVAFAILLCIKEIVTGLAEIGQALYGAVAEGTIFTAGDNTSDLVKNLQEIATEGSDARSTFETELESSDYAGIWAAISHFHMFVVFGVVLILGMAINLIGHLVPVGNAIMVLIYAVMSPLAVVNLFEEGSRSGGIRYLKKFAATCFTMAIIIVALQAVSAIQTQLLALACEGIVDSSGNAITELTVNNVEMVMSVSRIAPLMIPQLACITVMSGCAKISAEILGA